MSDGGNRSTGITSYLGTPNRRIEAGDGVTYAYREVGPTDASPLVLLQHFRGNLDNWDPPLIDAFARSCRVITVDYAGVGGSSGTTAHSIEQMATETIAFVTALELTEVDILGFSIGSFVAQQGGASAEQLLRFSVRHRSRPFETMERSPYVIGNGPEPNAQVAVRSG